MKNYISITIVLIALLNSFVCSSQSTANGTGWGKLAPSEPLLLNEKFQKFSFFHSDTTADMGNSNNLFEPDGVTVKYGYKNDSIEVPILGSTKGKIKYFFVQCAFAPKWKAAWAFRDKTENTTNVSDGFIEISRTFSSTPPTIHGWFIVDLRAIEFVEAIQWTHSSCGGTKRGVMCEISINNGKTWDTLRYQTGNYTTSFTKDITTGTKTMNDFNCQNSAYGMAWEDGIYAGNVLLRFGECGGQVPRIHDLKVYGTYSPTSSIGIKNNNNIDIYISNSFLKLSETSDVRIYNLTGKLIKIANKTKDMDINFISPGVYLIQAKTESKLVTKKIVINNN